MNKTVTVNLGGTVFHIDENAYEVLMKYLNAIKANFSAEQGREEIMQDIESRISEMFRERLKDIAEVITIKDVDEVTAQMGRPEEFSDGEKTSQEETISSTGKNRRRLFRNPDDKMLGGVCGGLSAYLDVDSVWIRLVWALLFFVGGTGFILYIILWIIIPEAKTTADKLQMRGEPVTISNIGKNVQDEMDAVKQNLKDGNKSGAVGRVFESIGEIVKFTFIAIGKIIAGFFMIIGGIIGIALFVSLFAVLFSLPFVHYPEFIHHIFISNAKFGWAFVGIVLAIGIPILLLAYGAARALFNLKKPSRVFNMSVVGLMIIGWILCFTIGSITAREFSVRDSFRKEIPVATPASKIIYVETDSKNNLEKNYDEDSNNIDDEVDLVTKDEKLFSRNVKLDIVKSPTDSFQLVEIFYSRGTSRKTALDNASRISYSYSQIDSVLHLNRGFYLGKDDKWRAQKVQLLLRVPVGARVRLTPSLVGFIYDVDNKENIYDADMVDRTWLMTAEGLTCVDCRGDENTIGGKKVHIHSDNGDTEVNIDENGVHIKGTNGANVSIDSNGVSIHK